MKTHFAIYTHDDELALIHRLPTEKETEGSCWDHWIDLYDCLDACPITCEGVAPIAREVGLKTPECDDLFELRVYTRRPAQYHLRLCYNNSEEYITVYDSRDTWNRRIYNFYDELALLFPQAMKATETIWIRVIPRKPVKEA